MRISDWSSDVCSADQPGEILVGMNIRDRRYRDIYRIDLATGQRTEVFRNERNYIDVVADPDFNIRLAIRGNADGSSTYLRLDPAGPHELMTIPLASLRNSKIPGLERSKVRRVGKEGVMTCRYRGARYNYK